MNYREEIRSTGAQDAVTESAVLQQVLALHPTVITIAELVRELSESGNHFGDRDAVDRAIRDLVGAGLLHRSESFVLPTRAALHFDELLGE